MKAVVADHLSKVYSGGIKAVDQVNIDLEAGEIFGFLGPNGAGKTTTVKILNGMLAASAGECRIFDIDPAREPGKIHAISGVVTEHAQMYDRLTGLENLVFYGSVFGIDPRQCEKRAEELLEMLALSAARKQKLGTYSTGMRQRLSLARALIHQPKILFLDEPTSGLDPESTQNVNRFIRGMAKDKGVTVFLCTHQLRYAQEICTRYGLIDKGKILAQGSLEQLRAAIFSRIKVTIKTNNPPAGLPLRRTGAQEYTIDVAAESKIPGIVRRIVEGGGDIYTVASERPSLEEIYFSLMTQGTEANR